jgi:hypothetical protein
VVKIHILSHQNTLKQSNCQCLWRQSGFDAGCTIAGWISMWRKMSVLPIIALGCTVIVSGCATRPVKHNAGKLHLVTAEDFAQILLAHCESGIQLGAGIESLDVSPEVKRLASRLRVDEENDRPTIVAWLAKQSKHPSVVGKIHSDEIGSEHSATVERLRRTSQPELNRYALRVMETHLREQLAFLRETPVEDKELRRIADAIWRRISLQLKELSVRPPA